MTENSYPKPIADVVAILTDICRHQNRIALVELLESSHAHFDAMEYDNWNGGTTTWALRLEVPTILFASVQMSLPEIEKEIIQKLSFLDRLYPNDRLGEVTITPLTSNEIVLAHRMTPPDIDVRHLWRDGYVRLFLSHASQHKVQVAALKIALFDNGISAFVAHEDIEPNREWQNEISLALRTMHAIAALFTVDFHESKWTDQEVGWALGRGVPVLSIRLGADPYGFVGKFQATRGTLEDPVSLANSITHVLLGNREVHGNMRRALVEAFVNSDNSNIAERLTNMVVAIKDFTDDEKDRLRNACSENEHIAGTPGISQAIYDAFGAPKVIETQFDEVPF